MPKTGMRQPNIPFLACNYWKENTMKKNVIWLGTLLTLLALPLPALAGPIQATLYKNPQCSCCEAYADYLR